MTRTRLALPFIGLLAIAIAACSSGSAGPTSAGGPTAPGGGQPTQPAQTQTSGGSGTLPCKAIEADVVAAVGKTLGKGEYGDTCTFSFGGSGDTAGSEGVVDVRLEASSDLGAVKKVFAGGDDVSGLGDTAYWASSVSVMYAVSKGHGFAVQLVLFGFTGDKKVLATTIMQSLLSHI